jgi:hypothetical protein
MSLQLTNKPLGHKSYGSIGHIEGSRTGPADHNISEGQTRILTSRARDKHDRIIVQEKLDGSNVSIARMESGKLLALQRKGWRADHSPYAMLRMFTLWVEVNRDRFDAIPANHRLCGEWLAQAHGTRYALGDRSPFVVFDLMTGKERLGMDYTRHCADLCDLPTAPLLHDGGPISVDDALYALGEHGHYGATDPAEGAVWRVERQGKVDFLGKYVRPEKIDGLYMGAEVTPIWNYIISPTFQLDHRVTQL